MTILIVNNYPSKKDSYKIDMIKNALLDSGISRVLVWSFSEINGQLPPKDVEAIVLSGSDSHLNTPDHATRYQSEIEFVRKAEVPVLGICFGHQLIGMAFGAGIYSLNHFIQGLKDVTILQPVGIFCSWKRGDIVRVEQNHKDCLSGTPKGFICLAKSQSCGVEAIKHETRPIYGVQAHIERATKENRDGLRILKNFVETVVGISVLERTVGTMSLLEMKQAIIDCFRDLQYDIVREDWQEVESKLKDAQKHIDAFKVKKCFDELL